MMRTTRYLAVLLVLVSWAHAQDRLRSFPERWERSASVVVSSQSAVKCQDKTSPKPSKAVPAGRKSVYGVLSLNPEGRLRSSGASKFYSSSGGTIEAIKEKESWMPTAHLGIGFAAGIMDLEFLVGGGSILNDDFRSTFLEAMIIPYFRLGGGVKVGPYVSFMNVEDPDWFDDSRVNLDGGDGIRSGVTLAVGNETAWFTVGAGYVDFAFDASTKDGWEPSRKELDLSGWLLHLGVAFTF